jgi:hypothetical protein
VAAAGYRHVLGAPSARNFELLWDINRNLKRLVEIVEETHLGVP